MGMTTPGGKNCPSLFLFPPKDPIRAQDSQDGLFPKKSPNESFETATLSPNAKNRDLSNDLVFSFDPPLIAEAGC